jgi:hypothetical protein
LQAAKKKYKLFEVDLPEDYPPVIKNEFTRSVYYPPAIKNEFI